MTKLKIGLDPMSLYRLARWINHRKNRVQAKLINRLLGGSDHIVWDIPYGDRETTKVFIKNLRENFPPQFLQHLFLFVNPGNGGAFCAYLVGTFPDTVMPYTRQMVNNIVGVAQTTQTNAMMLIALSVQGIFNMTIDPTPDQVDAAFETPEPNLRS